MNKVGSGDKILDWGVIIAALMLFAKTADVLSYFSPIILNDILGVDVGLIYGIVCAGLVEGLALALHFNRRAALSSTAQIVKWILLGISGICQVYDGFITTNAVAQMSDTMKAVLSYGVPLIPLLIMIMVFGIGHLPETGDAKQPFKGIKHMLPDLQRLWHGEGSTSVTFNQDVPQVRSVKRKEQANPTNGEK